MTRNEIRAVAVVLLIVVPLALAAALAIGAFSQTPDQRHRGELAALAAAGDLNRLEVFAAAGDVEAQMRLAQILQQQREPLASLVWWTAAAEQGEVWPMLVLAGWYSEGHLDVIPQDLQAAAHWYRTAALRGDAGGQLGYGRLLIDGRGLEQDVEEGLAWVTAAASQGSRSAFWALAVIYRDGGTVERDLVEAYALFTASLRLSDGDYGDGNAEREQLADLEAELTTAEIEAARARAEEWLRL